ncbi:unnamed protein product [Protopolystoma xenopodis]|uniref:Uncharacterized protein n=1 Tax=Protopolystoma xenopodis TaxID=117903 RepID=A0A3S5BQP5_9PLAT|nr:unnamed protein product [Protopolystoma xenopodis]
MPGLGLSVGLEEEDKSSSNCITNGSGPLDRVLSVRRHHLGRLVFTCYVNKLELCASDDTSK